MFRTPDRTAGTATVSPGGTSGARHAGPALAVPEPRGVSAEAVTHVFTGGSGEPVTALEDVSLQVEAGEFVAIVGSSGCGKTTLLRILAGLVEPTHGEVRVGSARLTTPRRDISMMFQAPTLLPWKTVRDNCLLPREIDHRVDDDDRRRADELLSWAGLSGFANRRPNELSGGMQQRVAICRALMADPSVLLLDEPFGALDAMTRDQMNSDLQRIWAESGVTTVLITHDIAEAVFLAQRVVVLSPRPGRIVDVIDVPLPRERDIAVSESHTFGETCARVRSHFVREAHRGGV